MFLFLSKKNFVSPTFGSRYILKIQFTLGGEIVEPSRPRGGRRFRCLARPVNHEKDVPVPLERKTLLFLFNDSKSERGEGDNRCTYRVASCDSFKISAEPDREWQPNLNIARELTPTQPGCFVLVHRRSIPFLLSREPYFRNARSVSPWPPPSSRWLIEIQQVSNSIALMMTRDGWSVTGNNGVYCSNDVLPGGPLHGDVERGVEQRTLSSWRYSWPISLSPHFISTCCFSPSTPLFRNWERPRPLARYVSFSCPFGGSAPLLRDQLLWLVLRFYPSVDFRIDSTSVSLYFPLYSLTTPISIPVY